MTLTMHKRRASSDVKYATRRIPCHHYPTNLTYLNCNNASGSLSEVAKRSKPLILLVTLPWHVQVFSPAISALRYRYRPVTIFSPSLITPLWTPFGGKFESIETRSSVCFAFRFYGRGVGGSDTVKTRLVSILEIGRVKRIYLSSLTRAWVSILQAYFYFT